MKMYPQYTNMVTAQDARALRGDPTANRQYVGEPTEEKPTEEKERPQPTGEIGKYLGRY